MADAALLADRVSSVLARNPHFSHRNLRCEAADGRVVLRGVVRSYYQKQMAQETLKSVDGVIEIENHLEVSWL
jgi:osmotically-inducible protein OsmY